MFGCFCFVCWVFWCCLCFLLHELSHPHFLHTKVVEFFTCLSERALDLRFDSCHVALGILMSPVSWRSAAASEEKKNSKR